MLRIGSQSFFRIQVLLLVVIFITDGISVPKVVAQRIAVINSYPITFDGRSYQPAWNSTDNTKLYFTSGELTGENRTHWNLKSYDFSKKNITIENLVQTCLFPSVCSNGTVIAYNSIDKETSEFSLWYWNVRSNTTKRATASSFGYIGNQINEYTRPSWSNDGQKIFLSGWSNNQNSYVLWSVSQDGWRNQITKENRWDVEAAVSPDGTKIAFSSWRSGAFEIWVSNLDGSNPVQLTFTGIYGKIWNRAPCWSPDGKFITFVSNVNGDEDIWYMTADGEKKSLLIGSPWPEFSPSWDPEGKRIAYCKNVNGKYDIWVSEILAYNSFIECDIPKSMVLKWNNTLEITIENTDEFDYNFTLKIMGDAFRPIIQERIWVNSQETWKRSLILVPDKTGNRTVRVELSDGINRVFEEYYQVRISKPAKLRAMQGNITKEGIPGQFIHTTITLINDSEEEARAIGLYLSGVLSKYSELSDYRIKTLEPNGGYVKIQIETAIPDSMHINDTIKGELYINGTNFESLIIPLSFPVLEKQKDPIIESAKITAKSAEDAKWFTIYGIFINGAILIVNGVITSRLIRKKHLPKKEG